jgi:hypothetical protein
VTILRAASKICNVVALLVMPVVPPNMENDDDDDIDGRRNDGGVGIISTDLADLLPCTGGSSPVGAADIDVLPLPLLLLEE